MERKFWKKAIIALSIFLILISLSILLSVEVKAERSEAGIGRNLAENEETNNFIITVKDSDNNEIPIANAEFIIKEIVYINNQEREFDPQDEKGNILGEERKIEGDQVRVFKTNEEGKIEEPLREGIYSIEQISTQYGYVLDSNKIKKKVYFGDKEDITSQTNLNVVDMITASGTAVGSYPNKYYIATQNDEKILFLCQNMLILMDKDYNLIKAIPCDTGANKYQVQILSREDGFDLLTYNDIYQYDNELNLINTITLTNGNGKSFTIDENGNYIVVSVTGAKGVCIEIYGKDSSGKYVEKENRCIINSGKIAPNSIEILPNGNYLITVYAKITVGVDDTVSGESFLLEGNQYYILTVDSSTYKIDKHVLTRVDSDFSKYEYKTIHHARVGEDGSIYYAGTIKNTVTFDGTQTASGENIVVQTNGKTDGLIMKLNEDLKVEWAMNLGGETEDHFYNMNVTPDGCVIIAGDSEYGRIRIPSKNTATGYAIYTEPVVNTSTGWRAVTAKINSEGKVEWAQEFGYPKTEACYAISVFGENDYVLAGFRNETGGADGIGNVIRVRESKKELLEEEIIYKADKLELTNDKEEYSISTEIKPLDDGTYQGTITGQDEEFVEKVKYTEDATKPITVKANDGYIIKSIEVVRTNEDGTKTAENIEVAEKKKEYTIDPISNITGEIIIRVEFREVEGTVVVHHYLEGTTTKVTRADNTEIEDVEIYKDIDEKYEVEANKDVASWYTLTKSPENASGTITKENLDVEVIFYYKLNNYNYTVEYYYSEELDNEKTEKLEAVYGSEITEYTDKNITGHKLDKVEGLPLTISENEEQNVIKVYYVKEKFNYEVYYYYDGERNKENTEETLATFGDKINSYKDKVIDGYKFERVDNLPLTVSENPINNIIRVYYVRKDAEVNVKYLDKVTGEEIAETVSEKGKVFDNYDISDKSKEIEGYTLIESPESLTGTFTEEAQTKTFYYLKNTEVTVKYLEKDNTPDDNTDNLVVSENDTIEGYEGKEYSTSPKEIEGYTYIESSNNTSGTMTREPITVNYYYLKNTKVIVNHIDKNTGKNIEVVEQTGKDGDEYTTTSKEFEGYILVEKPEKENGTMTKEEIIVNYYYVHISNGVVEKHIDYITEEILDNTAYEGNEGDEYTTKAKEFEGYDLVEEKLPENAEGTMTIELIEVKYYYIRKASVVVEYIDKVTGKKLLEKVEVSEEVKPEETETEEAEKVETKETEKTYKEVDSTEVIYGHERDAYKAKEKAFEGYDLIETPENAEGTMKTSKNEDGTVNTETKVTYYYAHKAEVIEKHVDVVTGKLIEDETKHEGHEAEEYSIKSKEIEGYDLVEDKMPENAEGKMTIEPITVTYYYIRKTSVKVEYIDKITGKKLLDKIEVKNPEDPESVEDAEKKYKEVDSTEYIYGHEGDEYKAKEKEFEGYDLVEVPENAEGIMKVTVDDENIVTETKVTYYYTHKAEVVEKHIDVTTNKVLEEKKHEGHEKDEYDIKSKNIEGYDVVEEKLPKNSKGEMTIEPIEVTYYYIRKVKVTVKYLENGTDKEILESKVIKGHEGDTYTTESKEIKGYTLIEDKLPENKEGKMEKEDIVVTYYYKSNSVPITPPNNTKAPGTADDGNGDSNKQNNSNQNGNTGTTVIVTSNGDGDSSTTKTTTKTTTKGTSIPNTGDILPIVAGGIVILVIVANIIVTVVNKKKSKE